MVKNDGETNPHLCFRLVLFINNSVRIAIRVLQKIANPVEFAPAKFLNQTCEVICEAVDRFLGIDIEKYPKRSSRKRVHCKKIISGEIKPDGAIKLPLSCLKF